MELVLQSAVETVDVCIEERILRYNKFAKEWNLRSLEKDDLSVRFTELSFEINWKPELEYDQWIWQLERAEKGQIARMVKKGCGSDQRRSVRNGETRSIRCRGSKA